MVSVVSVVRDNLKRIGAATNLDYAQGGGNAFLVEITGNSFNGTVDFKSSLDGETFTNTPYKAKNSLTAAKSVSQISNPGTIAEYIIYPPLAFMRVAVGWSSGTLDVTVREVTLDDHGVLVGASGGIVVEGTAAHDAVDTGNPVAIGGLAWATGNSAVAAGDRTKAAFDTFGKQLTVLSTYNAAALLDVASNPGDAKSNNAFFLSVTGLLRGYAPDAAWDRVKTLMDAVPGLGVIAAAPYTPGSSEVKSNVADPGATSATRKTFITPTSGKKIRIISYHVVTRGLTTDPARCGIYFGTGAAYLTNATTVIGEGVPGTTGSFGESWPDGGGPVGAADAVLSIVTETETEPQGQIKFTVHYREE